MARHHRNGRLVAWLLPALLAAVFVLAGCGMAGIGGASPTATPNATTIIQRAQSVKITDAALTLTLSGTSAGKSVTGSGTGKLTKTPPRSDFTFNLTAEGQQIAFESITDGTANVSYTQFTQPALLANGKWTKTSGGASSSLFDPSQFTDYSQLKNPTLVGRDTVNGTPVWHLKGQSTAAGESGTLDIFVRQDNYYPVQIKGQTTGTSTNLSIVLTYTSVNSGNVTITLPPADQVQSA